MFEPMLEDLLPQLRKSGVKVEEIWAVDVPLSGETAKANPIGYFYGSPSSVQHHLSVLELTAAQPTRKILLEIFSFSSRPISQNAPAGTSQSIYNLAGRHPSPVNPRGQTSTSSHTALVLKLPCLHVSMPQPYSKASQ